MIPILRRRFTIPRSSWILGRSSSEQSLQNPPAKFNDNDAETAAILREYLAGLPQDEGTLSFPTGCHAKSLEEDSQSEIATLCGSRFSLTIDSDDEEVEWTFFADDSTLMNESGAIDVVAIGRPAQACPVNAPSPISRNRTGAACDTRCYDVVDRVPTPAMPGNPFCFAHSDKS